MSSINIETLRSILTRSYQGRRILLTGHSGFVGGWLGAVLADGGAEVTGLSLPPSTENPSEPAPWTELERAISGDIRDLDLVTSVVRESRPEIIFHLAAQALVLPSYADPISTFATNVMGTAHVLEAIRLTDSVRACVVITSDKCYATSTGAHVEDDPLGGDDPYSASKGATEIVAHAYRSSFFSDGHAGVATARAGNIVGGGDWAEDRIIPDCVRAIAANRPIELRHPEATRPWQHVLDAVAGYLRLGDALLSDPLGTSDAWNFGPPETSAATVADVVEQLHEKWRAISPVVVPSPVLTASTTPPERTFLALDSSKARTRLGWSPLLDFASTMSWTARWYHNAISGHEGVLMTKTQINDYLSLDVASTARGEQAQSELRMEVANHE